MIDNDENLQTLSEEDAMSMLVDSIDWSRQPVEKYEKHSTHQIKNKIDDILINEGIFRTHSKITW